MQVKTLSRVIEEMLPETKEIRDQETVLLSALLYSLKKHPLNIRVEGDK